MSVLNQNYFELFDLPVDFTVDQENLSVQYRRLQQVMHPDRYANGTDQERRIALQQATLLNEAFETLKSPLLRAQYLLSLNGYDLKAKPQTVTDGQFLMQQMMLREKLSETAGQSDPFQALDELIREIKQAMNQLIGDLTSYFDDINDANLVAAAETVGKMQFFSKLQSEAEAEEARLEDEL